MKQYWEERLQTLQTKIETFEKQIEELKGALFVCHKLQEEKEEMETFEVEKYWNVIAEEEKKGNRFLDIAKDMVGVLLAVAFVYLVTRRTRKKRGT